MCKSVYSITIISHLMPTLSLSSYLWYFSKSTEFHQHFKLLSHDSETSINVCSLLVYGSWSLSIHGQLYLIFQMSPMEIVFIVFSRFILRVSCFLLVHILLYFEVRWDHLNTVLDLLSVQFISISKANSACFSYNKFWGPCKRLYSASAHSHFPVEAIVSFTSLCF